MLTYNRKNFMSQDEAAPQSRIFPVEKTFINFIALYPDG